MRYVDQIGLRDVARRLRAFAERSGDQRLEPAPLLARLAEQDSSFAAWSHAQAESSTTDKGQAV
ncbi:MAG: hypothetical protein LAT50_07630 [Ectothiorhodospiraceae bacterium]|nr:hypothetical protein [Ectothiorhodospiraceae bacterium]